MRKGVAAFLKGEGNVREIDGWVLAKELPQIRRCVFECGFRAGREQQQLKRTERRLG